MGPRLRGKRALSHGILWAADEIKKRTEGKYEVQVFPASELGNEPQINQALALGTVDIIYTGAAFAGGCTSRYRIQRALHVSAISITGKPIERAILSRSWPRGTSSSQATHRGAHLLRRAPHHVQQGDHDAGGHQGHEASRAAGAALPDVHQIFGANATPIAFAEVYLALQQDRGRAGNPLPTIQAKKFYEVQNHINLTGHIIEALVTVIGPPLLANSRR